MHAKKGFTLLETLVCLFVLSALSILVIPMMKSPDFRAETDVLDALYLQSEAMALKQTCTSQIQGIDFTYHLNGHPSSCNSYVMNGKRIIVHLGWGRISVK